MSKAAELAALIANVNRGSSLGNKNFLINSAMNVAQRGTSISTVSGFTLDRWRVDKSNTDNWAATITQSSTVPTGYGFNNSWKIDTTTAESALASDEYAVVEQVIEAQNLQSLSYGTSSAKAITLSFWVRSNVTGTYAISIYQYDDNRMINATYTISSANTWEKKEITFVGDTTGVIDDDTGSGLKINWILAAGSDYQGTAQSTWATYANAMFGNGQTANIMSSTDNEFLMTGCMLEIGEKATEFEHEPIGITLEKCQRYYTKYQAGSTYSYLGSGQVSAATTARIVFQFPTEMNHIPALEQSANNTLNVYATDSEAFSTDATINHPSTHSSAITCTVSSGLTQKAGASVNANGTTDAYLAFESEIT